MNTSREQLFFETVISHSNISSIISLQGNDAIDFIKGVGSISHHTYQSGRAIVNDLLAAGPKVAIEFILDHKGIVLYLEAVEGTITALVTKNPYRIRAIIALMPDDTAKETAMEAIETIIRKWQSLN